MRTLKITISGDTASSVTITNFVRADTNTPVDILSAGFSGGSWNFNFEEPQPGLMYNYTYVIDWGDGTTTTENDSYTATTIAGIPYQTVQEVDDYALTKLYTENWDAASDATKLKATYEASRIIDSLSYRFQKLDSNQFHEFPRTGQTTVPEDVLNAHAEIAIELLENPDSQDFKTGVSSERFLAVGITYDPKLVSVWLREGVPSERAWNYLLKYLDPADSIHLRRVS